MYYKDSQSNARVCRRDVAYHLLYPSEKAVVAYQYAGPKLSFLEACLPRERPHKNLQL